MGVVSADWTDSMAMYVLHDGFLFWGTRLCACEGSLRKVLIRELCGGGGLGGHVVKTLGLVTEK